MSRIAKGFERIPRRARLAKVWNRWIGLLLLLTAILTRLIGIRLGSEHFRFDEDSAVEQCSLQCLGCLFLEKICASVTAKMVFRKKRLMQNI